VYTFCLLFSYLIKVVALLYFICCYQQVLVNKDIYYHVWGAMLERCQRYMQKLTNIVVLKDSFVDDME